MLSRSAYEFLRTYKDFATAYILLTTAQRLFTRPLGIGICPHTTPMLTCSITPTPDLIDNRTPYQAHVTSSVHHFLCAPRTPQSTKRPGPDPQGPKIRALD
jgi:hypothetical protein